MTVFPDGSKERLHGHNYTLAVAAELVGVGADQMVEFATLKQAMAELCGDLREHLLLPALSPRLEVSRPGGGEVEFRLCGQRYVVPEDDVRLLPIDNVTVEALSAHLGQLLVERLGPILAGKVRRLRVTVEESPGQGASTDFAL
jgi:6-pyruvoyltetrahydropterin/6-carboxytetrahydropterin synthase